VTLLLLLLFVVAAAAAVLLIYQVLRYDTDTLRYNVKIIKVPNRFSTVPNTYCIRLFVAFIGYTMLNFLFLYSLSLFYSFFFQVIKIINFCLFIINKEC